MTHEALPLDGASQSCFTFILCVHSSLVSIPNSVVGYYITRCESGLGSLILYIIAYTGTNPFHHIQVVPSKPMIWKPICCFQADGALPKGLQLRWLQSPLIPFPACLELGVGTEEPEISAGANSFCIGRSGQAVHWTNGKPGQKPQQINWGKRSNCLTLREKKEVEFGSWEKNSATQTSTPSSSTPKRVFALL